MFINQLHLSTRSLCAQKHEYFLLVRLEEARRLIANISFRTNAVWQQVIYEPNWYSSFLTQAVSEILMWPRSP